jgi:hypothetical protein
MTLFVLLFFLALILLGAGLFFLKFVYKLEPQKQPKLSEQITTFTTPDLDANPIANSFKRSRVQDFTATARTQADAARVMTDLNSEYEKAVISDKTFDGRLKQQLLTLENQNEILERATTLGVPVGDYTRFMLKVLESKTELAKEAMSLRMSIDLAVAYSDRHFELIKQLQGQIRQLRIELHELPQKQLPETVQELEVADIKSQIASLEARLNEHLKQTGVSEVDGQTT